MWSFPNLLQTATTEIPPTENFDFFSALKVSLIDLTKTRGTNLMLPNASILKSMLILLVAVLCTVAPCIASQSAECEFIYDFVVTGGAGFIGSKLIKLLKKNDPLARVQVLDNLWRGR